MYSPETAYGRFSAIYTHSKGKNKPALFGFDPMGLQAEMARVQQDMLALRGYKLT
jgi:hypothetical protein